MIKNKTLVTLSIIFLTLPLIYSIIWFSFSSKIIKHFGGNSFCDPEFPKIGQYVNISLPDKYSTGYILKANLIPLNKEDLSVNWWEDNNLVQWLPSHETGLIRYTTIHNYAPFSRDYKYSSKVLTEDTPAYFYCSIANNPILKGESVNLQVYTDSTLLDNITLNILQPNSIRYQHYSFFKNIFQYCLIFLCSVSIIGVLFNWYAGKKYIIFSLGILVLLFFGISNPGRASFESYINRTNRTRMEGSHCKLVEINNYLLFSIGKVEVTFYKEGKYPEISGAREELHIGFFGGVN
jgi:hypothetical protein